MTVPIQQPQEGTPEARCIAGIFGLLAARPYTLDMPGNPDALSAVEDRIKEAGLQPYRGESLRFEHKGYTTLMGKKGSGNGPTIAFVFHYDIAPESAVWQIPDKHAPQMVAKKDFVQHMNASDVPLAGETLLVGKGVADMLGATEAMLQAAALIPENFPGECVFIATPDEERASVYGMIPLLAQLSHEKLLPDVMIGGESTYMDVLVRRRGGYYFDITLERRQEKVLPYQYRIVTHGTNMHPGVFTSAKRDLHANLKMAQVLGDIGTHQVLEILGGEIVNVIPNRCEAVVATSEPIDVDLLRSERVEIEACEPVADTHEVIVGVRDALEAIAQFHPPVEAESDFGISVSPNVIHNEQIAISSRVMQGNGMLLKEQLQKELASFSVTGADVSLSNAIQPFFSSPDHPAVQAATEIVREAGWNVTGNRENHGTSDLNFLYDYPEVLGFEIGPVGANEHGANEWVCLDSLLALPAIYKKVAEKIAAQWLVR